VLSRPDDRSSADVENLTGESAAAEPTPAADPDPQPESASGEVPVVPPRPVVDPSGEAEPVRTGRGLLRSTLARAIVVATVLGIAVAAFAIPRGSAHPTAFTGPTTTTARQTVGLPVFVPTSTTGRAAVGFQAGTSPSVKPTVRKTKRTTPPPPERVGTPVKPTASPTGTPTQAPVTLQDYLNLIPSFAAPPAGQHISLSHADGQAALVSRVPTTAKVAFITIDDGWYDLSLTSGLIDQSGIPVVGFLTTDAIESTSVGYFADLQAHGMVIEDHTITHPDLTTLDLAGQQAEICPAADQLGSWFGRRPIYMRAPYLNSNADTLTAAWSCGIKAVIAAEDGVENGVISYGTSTGKIQPGDVIVMHFEPDFAENFVAALQAIKAAGLTPAPLEDWISVS
jgi:peptidoglycan/xylan/chitin deacetylase (PgdA/CDA1 family)